MFAVAWVFLVCAVVIGLLLRMHAVTPLSGFHYGNFLHAHSHVAFLGWVFNAFFALALRFFVSERDGPFFSRLFWVMQVAVLGMLVAYPIQGYGRWSIAASGLHMLCSGVFAWKLWRGNVAQGEAGRYLRTALLFMVVSGVGPLALGPLAAGGLRDSPWYTLAIYFYLHCQYNGWFIFFLQAVLLQRVSEPVRRERARKAWGWLVVGAVLTFALAALWTAPPAWVRAIAVAGGVSQCVGAGYFFKSILGETDGVTGSWSGVSRLLAATAAGAYATKVVVQWMAAFPVFSGLALQRPVAIGFLHLVFLGIVIPLVVGLAVEQGWIKPGVRLRVALVPYFFGAGLTEWLLGYPALAGILGIPGAGLEVGSGLAVAAGAMVVGVWLLRPAFKRESAADDCGVIVYHGARHDDR